MVEDFETMIERVIKESKEQQEKWSNQWKRIIGDIVWMHLEIENAMLSAIIDLQKIGLNSKEYNEIVNLNYLGAAKVCFFLKYIDNELYKEIQGFNISRNNIIHKIFKNSDKTKEIINQIEGILAKGAKTLDKIYESHFSFEKNQLTKHRKIKHY